MWIGVANTPLPHVLAYRHLRGSKTRHIMMQLVDSYGKINSHIRKRVCEAYGIKMVMPYVGTWSDSTYICIYVTLQNSVGGMLI